jgi:hypothetical protein
MGESGKSELLGTGTIPSWRAGIVDQCGVMGTSKLVCESHLQHTFTVDASLELASGSQVLEGLNDDVYMCPRIRT